MYYNGQTLRHKTTNALISLAISGDSQWAWDIGDATKMIDEEGKPFTAPYTDYCPVVDERGKIHPGNLDGKGPDLSLKRYVKA